MIVKLKEKIPQIHSSVFIAENAAVVGACTIGEESSVWYSATVRGDEEKITIGSYSNVQDSVTLHADYGYPVLIGDYVTIGHNCVIHGCTIKDNALIGMGSVILNGAEIGENVIVGAGSLITQNKTIPPGVLVMGSPAKIVRPLTEEEIATNRKSAEAYAEVKERFR